MKVRFISAFCVLAVLVAALAPMAEAAAGRWGG